VGAIHQVLPGERRKALERLAGLECEAGSYEAAEKHYQSAADSLNASPAVSDAGQAAIYNNLAVLHLLRGDSDGAEMPLNRAVSKSSKADSMYGQSVNNLAVLAELRGDRRKAEALYDEALRALAGMANSSGQERRAVLKRIWPGSEVRISCAENSAQMYRSNTRGGSRHRGLRPASARLGGAGQAS